jgi:hypothetical protein
MLFPPFTAKSLSVGPSTVAEPRATTEENSDTVRRVWLTQSLEVMLFPPFTAKSLSVGPSTVAEPRATTEEDGDTG